jgi:transposase
VDKAWLSAQLAAGTSIEAIARSVGRHPSSVAYWVHKYGLASMHAARHAPRGGIPRDRLTELIDEGLSIRGIAERLGLSYATVRHWLRKHGLETRRAARLKVGEAGLGEPLLLCPEHGLVAHVRGSDGYLRCRPCRAAAVIRRRARVRATLIAEAGGCCAVCGYDAHPAALQFHHVDRATKMFNLRDGTTRSLARMRDEARKCVLLCANCHAQVEAGAADLPVRSTDDAAPSGVAQSDIPG